MALKFPMGMVARSVVLGLITDYLNTIADSPESTREQVGAEFDTEGRKLSSKRLEKLKLIIEKQTGPRFKQFDKQLKKYKQRQKDKASGKTPKKTPPPGFGKKKAAADTAKVKPAAKPKAKGKK